MVKAESFHVSDLPQIPSVTLYPDRQRKDARLQDSKFAHSLYEKIEAWCRKIQGMVDFSFS